MQCGLGSDLYHILGDAADIFYAITDRGPKVEQSRCVMFQLDEIGKLKTSFLTIKLPVAHPTYPDLSPLN